MLINNLPRKKLKIWEQQYPVAAKQLAAIRRQAPRVSRIWATRHKLAYHQMYIECVIRIGDFFSLDPFHLAIEICRELEPECDSSDVMSIDYDAHVINAAGARIHWICDQDESDCANALAELPKDTTLDQIKAAFTLPYSHDDEWLRLNGRDIIHKWVVSGTAYQVFITKKRSHPLLQNPAGYWIHPDWMTLSEAAAYLSYEKTSSLRVAIYQGRLPSKKIGNTHLVRPTDIQAAIREGRLKPRKPTGTRTTEQTNKRTWSF